MNIAFLESKVNGLPQALRTPMLEIVRELDKLSFGAPAEDGESAEASENFSAHLVPFTTSSVADREVAVAHGLGRVARLCIPLLDPNTVGSRLVGDLVITRAADATYVYVSSGETSIPGLLYVE